MTKALTALAIGTFALGIAEFTMMGILGDVAHSLDISIVKAGHLISAYATGVAVGAPMLIFLRRWPLKRLLLLLATFIAVGNAAAARRAMPRCLSRVLYPDCPTVPSSAQGL